MTKGKPWDATDEQQLRELVKERRNAMEIAEVMDKTYESVASKIRNLSLSVKEAQPAEQTVASSLDLSLGLPSVEEKLKVLNAALVALEQPGLNRTEVLRLRSVVQGVKTYREEYEKYVDYLGLELEVLELRRKVDESKVDVLELRRKLEESKLDSSELRSKLEEANKISAEKKGSDVSS